MNSHTVLPFTEIEITRVIDGKNIKIRLYSSFTLITGKSGICKSFFINGLAQNMLTREFVIKAEYPISFARDYSELMTTIQLSERHIIVVDESSIISADSNSQHKIRHCNHIFLCVGRNYSCKSDYPLQGIYFFEKQDDWFSIERAPELNVSNFVSKVAIVTESAQRRSECELLERFFNVVIPAGGIDNVNRLLRGSLLNSTETITVFIDLGNIGRNYLSLYEKLSRYPNINVYDYQCFEQLIYYSDLIVNRQKEEPFNYFSIENMYEDMLERAEIGYKHKKPLPSCVMTAPPRSLFDNIIGRGILSSLDNDDEIAIVKDKKAISMIDAF